VDGWVQRQSGRGSGGGRSGEEGRCAEIAKSQGTHTCIIAERRRRVERLRTAWLLSTRRDRGGRLWARRDRSTGRGRNLFFAIISRTAARLGLRLRLRAP
jgi:hypothetical protein